MKKNIKFSEKIFCAVAALICCFMMAGCASGDAEAAAAAAGASPLAAVHNYAPNGFVTLDEFCKARLIHVNASLSKPGTVTGSCYVDNKSMDDVVPLVIKRALKSHNIAITQDRASADYVIEATLQQRLIRRRTYTTLKVVFSENKNDRAVIWTGAGAVSARGSYPAGMYSASLSGAVMYNFLQYVVHHVNNRMLQSYYSRLAVIGD